MWMILAGLVWIGASGPRPDGAPEPLRRMVAARAAIGTGDIELTVVNGPRVLGMPVNRYAFSFASNGDSIVRFLGDEDGVLGRNEQGEPMQVGETRALRWAEGVVVRNTWEGHSALFAPHPETRVAKLPSLGLTANFDPRSLGLGPTWWSTEGCAPDEVLPRLLEGAVKCDVEQSGPVHVVRVEFAGERELVFEIDETKGWNATRIVERRGDKELVTEVSLRAAGGNWFPESVQCYEDGALTTHVHVTAADINPPQPVSHFSPDDVGVEVGMRAVGVDDAAAQTEELAWDGAGVRPWAEVRERIASGELTMGPTARAAREGRFQPPLARRESLRYSSRSGRAVVSAWEFYVVQFCAQYELNREQRAQAQMCLRRAQTRANEYLDRKRGEFESLQRAAEGEGSTESLRKRLAVLRRPIDEIFENELKPCLEKIPTRAQRAGVETASQPAKR